jgi:hypothetical protein
LRFDEASGKETLLYESVDWVARDAVKGAHLHKRYLVVAGDNQLAKRVVKRKPQYRSWNSSERWRTLGYYYSKMG